MTCTQSQTASVDSTAAEPARAELSIIILFSTKIAEMSQHLAELGLSAGSFEAQVATRDVVLVHLVMQKNIYSYRSHIDMKRMCRPSLLLHGLKMFVGPRFCWLFVLPAHAFFLYLRQQKRISLCLIKMNSNLSR